MNKGICLMVTLAFLPTASFAKDTKGIEGLRQYDCSVVSEKGELERLVPINKSVLAQSKAQATALYLIHLDAAMNSKQIGVTYQITAVNHKNDILKEVSCTLVD